jgi:mannose-1-phosphate guanylyltransferase
MQRNQPDRLWSIVLAGGEGERIKPLIMRWLGQPKPKQYCTFTGNRSMLEHTLDRAARMSGTKRKVTVIARSHQQEARLPFAQHPFGTVIEQPTNRDTAAGIFLPLSIVRARDPQATVVVYPSDHFVYPEERFELAVRSAACAAEQLGDKLVLLGVTPDRAELEYGWIRPGTQLGYVDGRCVRSVEEFCEKPGLDQARTELEAGSLWNTLVFATKVETLWEMGWSHIPEIMPKFETLCEAIDTPTQQRVLDYIYRDMPSRNFSAHLLARATAQIAVVAMEDVLWSDWGRPQRIVDTLSEMGKEPAFPLECLAAGG